MKTSTLKITTILFIFLFNTFYAFAQKPVRLLIVTGGHDYNKETFNEMLTALGKNITCHVSEFPEAYSMFLPENRHNYDVLVFYHMWQSISEDQKKTFADCIAEGKPLVVLHHSICAFDNWEEYINIVGGKYFHKPTVVDGKQYEPSSYKHDLKLTVRISDKNHPVTKGLSDFELFDESYDNYYVKPGVKPLLETDEPTSTSVIGWSHTYGKSRVVTIQSGHDTPTFQNANFRKLVSQAIEWVYFGK